MGSTDAYGGGDGAMIMTKFRQRMKLTIFVVAGVLLALTIIYGDRVEVHNWITAMVEGMKDG